MASAVDICNLALQRLGARSIASLTENTTAGRECNRVYEHARDTELRAHPWSFARARAELAASSTAPTFGFAAQYPLPSDYVRLLPARNVADNVTVLGGIDPNIDWQIEGRSILTDDTAPLQIVYLKKVTDPNDFDDLFTDLLVARIAMDIAEKVTQSNTKKADAQNRYAATKAEAKKINAFERPPQEFPADEWVVARL
jgi:hypothetical protein